MQNGSKPTIWVYEARFEGVIEGEQVPQLFAARSLQQAVQKAKKWLKEEQQEQFELVSVVRSNNVVI